MVHYFFYVTTSQSIIPCRDWAAIPPTPANVFKSGGKYPHGVAVTRSHTHLVVANFSSANVTLLSLTDGHVERTIGTEGSFQGQFLYPLGVSVDPHQGYLWVADQSNHRVQLFTEDGHFVRQFACCQSPSSVAFLSNGDVAIASLGDKKLHLYSSEGELRRSVGSFDQPWQLAVVPPAEGTEGGEEYLAVADCVNNCVQIVSSTDGHVVRTLATAGPYGVLVTPDRYLIVVESGIHTVGVFSSQGERVHQWGSNGSAPGQFRSPTYCSLLPDGRVAIADCDNHRIQLF